MPEKPQKPKDDKLKETYLMCFGKRSCPKDRIHERRRVMQCLIFLLQMKGVKYGYDDFDLTVCGVHSVKLSFDLNKLGLMPNDFR